LNKREAPVRVVTRHFQLEAPLTDYLQEPALAVIRRGDGIVGIGETLRLSASGSTRFEELAAAWNELVSNSVVEDEVLLPGTGLTAFGSFTFSSASELTSVLVVPEVIIGVRDGRAWITRFNDSNLTVNPNRQRPNKPIQLFDGNLSALGYQVAVTAAVAEIKSGTLEKVVLARDLVGSTDSEFDLRGIITDFTQNYPDCWTYAVDGTFGASPELLVRVSHGQVATRVLAGTTARGANEGEDRTQVQELLESEKNRYEHRLALESVIDSLTPLTARIDFDEHPFAVQLPNLIHLASDVHAVLAENSTGLDLVAALHPTAAVAGTPRAEALELIAELEPFDRGRFASPVGWISSNGDCEWAIALRGGQLSGDQIKAYAGCGVVADSSAENELAETELKFRPMRGALG